CVSCLPLLPGFSSPAAMGRHGTHRFQLPLATLQGAPAAKEKERKDQGGEQIASPDIAGVAAHGEKLGHQRPSTERRPSARRRAATSSLRMRWIRTTTKKSMKATAMISSGQSMLLWIVGVLIRLTLAGWCSVFHQSTQNLMIGRLMTPTSARTAPARRPRSSSSKALVSAM